MKDFFVMIKSKDPEKIKDTLINEFGFIALDSDILVGQSVKLKVFYNDKLQPFIDDFLKDQNMEDSTPFYNLLDTNGYDTEILVSHLTNDYDSNHQLIKTIFQSITEILPAEVIVNFNESKYSYFKEGSLMLLLEDYR